MRHACRPGRNGLPRRLGSLVCVFLLSGVLSGCGGSTPPQQLPIPPKPQEDPAAVQWPMLPGGLSYTLECDQDLNLTGEHRQGLTACVYQLKTTNGFDNIAHQPGGIDMLLNANLAEVQDAVGVRVYQLQPGEKLSERIDRLEGAKWLAVVAGYDHLRPDLCAVVFPYLMHASKEGVIFRTVVYEAAPMTCRVLFGAQSVSIVGGERVR